jgi:hypothetical protein
MDGVGFAEECAVKEKSDGGPTSAFPAVHGPASSLVPYAFPIDVNRIGRRIWSLVAACTAIWSGRKNAAYSALVSAETGSCSDSRRTGFTLPSTSFSYPITRSLTRTLLSEGRCSSFDMTPRLARFELVVMMILNS